MYFPTALHSTSLSLLSGPMDDFQFHVMTLKARRPIRPLHGSSRITPSSPLLTLLSALLTLPDRGIC